MNYSDRYMSLTFLKLGGIACIDLYSMQSGQIPHGGKVTDIKHSFVAGHVFSRHTEKTQDTW